MKSLLIKVTSVVLFLLIFLKSWAVDVEPNSGELPWFKQSWAWIIPVAGFVVLIFAFIKTGEKKPR